MKNLSKITVMAMLAMSVFATSCNNDDEGDPTPTTSDVSGTLSSNQTWSGVKYISGKVVVPSGVTLTIEPGTIVKARSGQGTEAAALVVARGGMINAVGTPAQPIIFTSDVDDIQLGQVAGSNLEREDNQLWGGVVVLGRAPISAEDGDTEANIEGIPAEAGYGLFGGSDSLDNSGTMAYVSIRHGGISIGEGNELQGLTLGGVGKGTSISNIEIYANLDDGIECFGGTVDVSDLLVYYQGDDGIDLDMNYSGTISNFAVIHGDGIGTDEGLEIDGPEGTTYTNGLFTLNNGICMNEGADGTPADFKSRAQGYVNNVTFIYGSKAVKIRTGFEEDANGDADCNNMSEDAYTHLAFDGTLVLNETILSSVNVYDADADDDNPTACPTELDNAQSVAAGLVDFNGTGASFSAADLATMFNWTCAASRGQL